MNRMRNENLQLKYEHGSSREYKMSSEIKDQYEKEKSLRGFFYFPLPKTKNKDEGRVR